MNFINWTLIKISLVPWLPLLETIVSIVNIELHFVNQNMHQTFPLGPLPVGVGVESGAIPDNQLTSSSVQGPEYGPQYSRLNSRSGRGAWCAGACDPSNYLQIDLGLVHLVREVSHTAPSNEHSIFTSN